MNELPLDIRKAVRRYEPIPFEGFTLHPYRVENFYEYLAARPSLDFMQQSLPPMLMSVPLLEAYYRIDSGLEPSIAPNGLFTSALLALSLALRLMPNGTILDQVKQFAYAVDKKDPGKLKALKFIREIKDKDGPEKSEPVVMTITTFQFQRMRPIIAAQNGIELESETANPELIQAERDLAEASAPKLDLNLEDMISATALLTGSDECEIYEWPILKMTNRLNSAKRILDYMVCGIGETQGTAWKGGNPVPNPWCGRARNENRGLVPIEQVAGGQGLEAIQKQTEQGDKTL